MRFDTGSPKVLLDRSEPRLIGFAATAGRACFHAHARASDRPSARCVTAWLGPSIRVASSELLRHYLGPRSFRSRAHCQGFRALFVTSPVRVHSKPGSQPSFGSVPRRSQPLDGFLRAPAPGLVSSPSHVQDTLPTVQGLLSPRRATGSSPGAYPLAVGKTPLTGVTARCPRRPCLDFEALLCAGPRSRGSSYSPERRSLPSSVFAPPGSPSPGPHSNYSGCIRSRRS